MDQENLTEQPAQSVNLSAHALWEEQGKSARLSPFIMKMFI